jgi:death on curing protein
VIRYLSVNEILELHNRVMQASGGSLGLLDLGALELAVAQPRMVFADEELYPTLPDKAAALGFSLIQNHPFLDGNKRTGHAAMETFLVLNGHEIKATVDEQENVMNTRPILAWLGGAGRLQPSTACLDRGDKSVDGACGK